jgi:hypothetical protein
MASSGFDARLAQERRARLQAERLLALRSEELYSANRKLSEHAHALSHQVIEQREENAALKGQTTQVAAELEVATDRATQAERRLWDALTAVEDGFAIFDRDCRLVAANPAYLAPFEGMPDVAPGASYDAILRIAVDEGIVDIEGVHPDDWLETMLKRWEGDTIPQRDIRLWNGTYIRLIDKRTPQGDMVCLGMDITETIHRERELREARDAALAASRAKSTFLANMSHEIRTPMNGVVSMAELLGETDLDADQKLYADTIRHSGEALLQIIKDILDYSKIEAGKVTLNEGRFDLLEVILEVFGLLRPGIEGRDLDFELDIDLDCPDSLVGDCGRLRQVLLNLVGNAVKFTESGHVRVTVAGAPAGDTGRIALVLSVQDTGIGIPPEMQEHVFGEFNQVEEQANRSRDGTGLGLAITRRLVGLMGGTIRLDSVPGQGSTFTVELELGRSGDGAVPGRRLPPEARTLLLVGPIFSERAHDLIAALGRLGARIRAQPRPRDMSGGAESETVVLSANAETAAAWAEQLRANGATGPILHFCDDPDEAAPGLAPLISTDDPDVLSAITPGQPAGAAETSLAPWEPQPDQNAEAAPAAAGRLALLAAEDNRTNQLVFRKMLKSLDVELVFASDGKELVEAYKESAPDLVFSDISMPGMDGLEATGLIRAHEAAQGLPRVPIIAMTAHAVDGDRDRFLAAGMDGYVSKPLKKSKIFDCIAAFAPAGRNPVS